MKITQTGITFTPEEIMAAAEPDERPIVDPSREPTGWVVSYEVYSFAFGEGFRFTRKCDSESEARAYAAQHPLAEKVQIHPIF